jgi:hypothetical protein
MITLEATKLTKLISLFKSEPTDGELFADSYYQDITDRIFQQGNEGWIYLEEVLPFYDRQSRDNHLDVLSQARVRAILFALSQAKSPRKKTEVTGVLESYLEDSRPIIVAEAIDGLRHQKSRKYNIRVLSLLNHSSPFVRGSVLRFFAALYPEQALLILLRSLDDIDAIVRENAVDELGDLGDEVAIAPLKALLEKEKEENVREAIETALEILSA